MNLLQGCIRDRSFDIREGGGGADDLRGGS